MIKMQYLSFPPPLYEIIPKYIQYLKSFHNPFLLNKKKDNWNKDM